MSLKEDLKKIVSGDVLDDKDTKVMYSHDASLFEVVPEIVIFPKNADDIKNVVCYINEHKKDGESLSLTARAAGTCMSGGSLNTSIIFDSTKYMNKIHVLTKEKVIVEPGCFYRDLEKRTLSLDVIMPAYTASKELCAVGGMVGNNAGGEKTFSYGKVENYIRRLKVIFSDGNEYEVVPLNKAALDAKMAQGDFEGDVYKKIFDLIEQNYEEIKKAKPEVTKNSAGYYLWNVWDRETGIFDLTRLIVGSQGTLAIVTEIEFALVPTKPLSRMLVIFMKDIKKLGDLVDTVVSYKPETIESYDDYSMKLAMRFFFDFFKQLGFWGAIKLGLQFIPDMLMVLKNGGFPKLILLVELAGNNEDELLTKAEEIQRAVNHFGHQTKIAKTKAEVEKYFKIRRESFSLLRKHVQGKRTAPFIDDIIVNPHHLPEFLPKVQKVLDEYKLEYTIAGHAGNGNFHIIPLMDLASPISADVILEVSDKIYALVAEYKGSITAEHNDGIIRTPYLSYMFSKKILTRFEKTKENFDPHTIFNPGKKVGGGFDAIKKYMITKNK